MSNKFKVGDKVRRKTTEQDHCWCNAVGENHKNDVFEVTEVSEYSVGFRDMVSTWDKFRFELVSEQTNKIRVGDVYKDGTGHSVRIICVDRKDDDSQPASVLGLRKRGDGTEYVVSYTENGNMTNSRHSYNHEFINYD